jgi:hypoxanthine-DNA glycosylase
MDMSTDAQFIHSFPPIANGDAKVLILGSMPGVQSLRQNQYYANPRNHFWPIISGLFKATPIDYQEKINLLITNKIALWDVVYTCRRKGSMDSEITQETPNDILRFIQIHSKLKMIAFNGTKAHSLFKKHFGLAQPMDLILLPSTSPTPWRYKKTLEDKLKNWEVVLSYL